VHRLEGATLGMLSLCNPCAQVLPSLNGVLPEAALNLVIHHLRRGELGGAHALVKDLEPSTPQEYILKVRYRGPQYLGAEEPARGRLEMHIWQWRLHCVVLAVDACPTAFTAATA
jgi:hypothetical protein